MDIWIVALLAAEAMKSFLLVVMNWMSWTAAMLFERPSVMMSFCRCAPIACLLAVIIVVYSLTRYQGLLRAREWWIRLLRLVLERGLARGVFDDQSSSEIIDVFRAREVQVQEEEAPLLTPFARDIPPDIPPFDWNHAAASDDERWSTSDAGQLHEVGHLSPEQTGSGSRIFRPEAEGSSERFHSIQSMTEVTELEDMANMPAQSSNTSSQSVARFLPTAGVYTTHLEREFGNNDVATRSMSMFVRLPDPEEVTSFDGDSASESEVGS